MSLFLHDFRYGIRTLLKNPGFAAAAILSLGIGIGANTAIFSVTNALLLRPLPFADAERLAILWNRSPGLNIAEDWFSTAQYFDIATGQDTFEALAIAIGSNFNLTGDGEPQRVGVIRVSSNLLPMLGVAPVAGQLFTPEDDLPGHPLSAILSHGIWMRRYGGDPEVVGRTISLNSQPVQIVGVLPQSFSLPREVLPTLGVIDASDIFLPLPLAPTAATVRTREDYNILGKLKPGVTVAQAQAQLDVLTARLRRDFPDVYPPNGGLTFSVVPLLEQVVGDVRRPLIVLLGSVGFVLLIACANVANLTLARMLGRDRELALRSALGAGRGRLVRQLLTESTLLAAAGGAVGVAFAVATVGMLTTFVGRFTARTGEVSIDPAVLGFTMLVSIVTGLLFGTLPALGARVNLTTALKQGGNQAGDGAGRRRMQSALIVAQVAVSVVLLVGAGLLLASFYRLQQVDAGYRSDGVLSAEIYGNFSRYGNISALRRLYLPVLERLEGQPGVVSAAITNAVPLAGAAPGTIRFDIENRVTDDPDRRPATDIRIASDRYFETIGIPLLSGRRFGPLDTDESLRVAVINRAMSRYWDGHDPIGTRVTFNRGEDWFTVVGVVGDVRQFGLAQETVAQVYLPLTQSPQTFAGQVLVRTAGSPDGFAATLRQTVHAVDPNQPVERVQTLDDLRAEALAAPRLTATLLSIFAGLALLVTLAGLGGVIATSVTQRTREFGVRMALGATRPAVMAMVLRQGLVLVGVGLALGVLGAAVAGRVLSAYLYQTTPRDPLIIAGVVVAFLAAATLACLAPARRATTVDPLIALRTE